MKGYFRRGAHDKSVQHWSRIGSMGGDAPPPEVFHGHAVTTTAKGTCDLCNRHWMSRLEVAARPALEPMLQGHRVSLDPGAQRTLAEWITLKMMVWEQINIASAVFTRDQTLAFARDRTIPENVVISILKSKHTDMRARITRAFIALFLTPSETPVYFPVGLNTQTTLFRVGRLIIHFSYSRLPELDFGEHRQTLAKRLWPPRRRLLSWPPINSVGDAEEDHIAASLARLIEAYGARPVF